MSVAATYDSLRGPAVPKPAEVETLGSCTFHMSVGQEGVPCPCDRGVFSIPYDAGDEVECQKCGHHPSQHEGKVPSKAPRDVTVQALWDQLQNSGVVHARGTPGSGKSTLAELLQTHVQKTSPDVPVHRMSWPTEFTGSSEPGTPYHSYLSHILGQQGETPENCLNERGLLIVDDGHRSYQYPSFWSDLMKNKNSGSGPRVAFFSSYDPSPRGPPEFVIPESDVQVSPQGQVFLKPTPHNPQLGLSFSRAEFDDVLSREFGPYNESGRRFVPDADLSDYLWHLTGGHPAALRAVLDGLTGFFKYRDFSKHSPVITTDDALEFLENDVSMLGCLRNNLHKSHI